MKQTLVSLSNSFEKQAYNTLSHSKYLIQKFTTYISILKALRICGVKSPIYFLYPNLLNCSILFLNIIPINILWSMSLEHRIGKCLKRIKTIMCYMPRYVFVKGVTATGTLVNIHKVLTFLWDHTEHSSARNHVPLAQNSQFLVYASCQKPKTVLQEYFRSKINKLK